MAGRGNIFARVREILTEVLGVDEDGDKSLFKCCCENLKYLAQRTRQFRPQRRFDRLSHQTFDWQFNQRNILWRSPKSAKDGDA